MAPAIVHFLVGAALVLSVAAPLALRGGASRHHLWFVAVGGLWGISPDFHHVTPVFGGAWRRFHRSPGADVFALHYTLDRPLFDANPIGSTAAALAVFFVAVVVFSAADSIGERTRRAARTDRRHALAERVLVSGYAVAITGVLAGLVAGILFAETGRIESLAALAGRDVRGIGWGLLLTLSWVATAAFALLVAIVDATVDATNPGWTAALGLCFAIVAWAVVVAVGVPIWLRVALGRSQPIPYVNRVSLAALVGFGLVLGVVYPVVSRLVAPPADRAGSHVD